MFDLANKFWDWKKQRHNNRPLKTELGYTIDRWPENKFAARSKSLFEHGWVSLACGDDYVWGKTYSKYFTGTKEQIESKFGKILDLED